MAKQIILGIGGIEHGSAAALMADGMILAAAEEERFNRVKYYTGYPEQAINFCLKQAGVTMADITDVAIGNYIEEERAVNYPAAQYPFTKLKLNLRCADIPEKASLYWVPHHLAHVASAVYTYGLNNAAFLSVDYMGEWDGTAAGAIVDGEIKMYFNTGLPHSLGILYGAITEYLGFRAMSDEYKVMGLASHGSPVYIEELRRLVVLDKGGTFRLAAEYFDLGCLFGNVSRLSPEFVNLLGHPRHEHEKITARDANIASSLQLLMRECLMHMLKNLKKLSGMDRLYYTGEVAMNCELNTAIAESKIFKHIHIHPASHDSGTAIGACAYVDGMGRNGNRSPDNESGRYLGPGFGEDEIKTMLDEGGLSYTEMSEDELALACAEDINSGKIIGWFQGRMEWGPRALGNRSILADPRRGDMTEILNEKIKLREAFRPFAPSVLSEHAREYFDFPVDTDMSYMLYLARAKTGTAAQVPAAVHVDGTSRIQTVAYEQNPLYWKMIYAFKKLTGVPMVLNTSFNVKGEPIVCSPVDAIKCFTKTGIDVLYIGRFRAQKKAKTRQRNNKKEFSKTEKKETGGALGQ